jgi:hypothetical protein
VSARRQIIAALSEDSHGGIATLHAVERAEQLVDAHRAECIGHAVARLRAIPVTCTALTGPVWYGDGWKSAITCLEEIGEYQLPDDEAYPGELQRLRTLALQIRAVARKGGSAEAQRAEAQRVMDAHVTWEKDATSNAAPDFFQPGRTYTEDAPFRAPEDRGNFQCVAVAIHPTTGNRRALGFEQAGAGAPWKSSSFRDEEWADGWVETTEGGGQ